MNRLPENGQPNRRRRLVVLGTALAAITGLAIGAALLLLLGGSEDSDLSGSREAAGAVDAELERCVTEWNGRAGEGVRGVAARTPATRANALTARMVLFSDGVCGLTVPQADPQAIAFSTYVERGGRFEAYINTSGQGFGERPSPDLLLNGEQFAEDALRNPNVEVLQDGTVSPLSGASIAGVDSSSALAMVGVDGTTSGDAPYVLDAEEWLALSRQDQVAALAAYAADQRCPTLEVQRIGEAVRDGIFVVVDDSLEATLGIWCGGDTPEVSTGSEGDGSYEQAPASCGAEVEIIEGSADCTEAERIFEIFFSGGGIRGSTAEGTDIEDWNCGGARMGNPSTCVRDSDGTTISSSR